MLSLIIEPTKKLILVLNCKFAINDRHINQVNLGENVCYVKLFYGYIYTNYYRIW